MHKDKAYVKDPTRTIDGVKTGEIDKMFLDDDGGAIQYITPFNIEILRDLKMIEVLK